MTTSGWGSPPAGPGNRSSATSGSSAPTWPARTSPSSGSATCRATCSATGCCSRRTSGCWRRSTTPMCSSTPTPIRRRAWPSAGGCSRCRAQAGTTTTARSSPPAAACTPARPRRSRSASEVRAALGIEAESLAPNELISAILRAPVDLLFNGGIGTYVKASSESHGDAGDRANDGVRVDGAQLRCRVVAEGGNLGLTQRGRIEYALAGGSDGGGGRINTDAIDNVAGVNCSDHEVNIKILLGQLTTTGEIERPRAQRAAAPDDRRGGRAGPLRELHPDAGDEPGPQPGDVDGRGARPLDPPPRAGGAA